MSTLKEIWNLCENKSHHYLDREGFAVACRLIALAQENIPISPGVAESTASKNVLPKFQGVPDPWTMFPEEKKKYTSIFTATDADGDGYITGMEAASFFQRSGAKTDDLRLVWNLSDLDKDGNLNLEEFCIAMHLTVKIVKSGLPVPDVLPACLIPQSSSQSSLLTSNRGMEIPLIATVKTPTEQVIIEEDKFSHLHSSSSNTPSNSMNHIDSNSIKVVDNKRAPSPR